MLDFDGILKEIQEDKLDEKLSLSGAYIDFYRQTLVDTRPIIEEVCNIYEGEELRQNLTTVMAFTITKILQIAFESMGEEFNEM